MRRKCKFMSNNDYREKDGYLLGFSIESKNSRYGFVYQYPIALIETKEFGKHVLKEVPIKNGNIIFEDMNDL